MAGPRQQVVTQQSFRIGQDARIAGGVQAMATVVPRPSFFLAAWNAAPRPAGPAPRIARVMRDELLVGRTTACA
jgi:hypothetical protein